MTAPRRRPSRVQWVVGVLLVALVGYWVLIADRAVILLEDPSLVSRVLGVTVFVFPAVGVYVVAQELRFGAATATLARRIDPAVFARDRAEVDALPRTPAGRVERPAADALFARRQADVEADPGDVTGWYRLAQAYDLAGDRKRARAAMRHAIGLAKIW